MCTSSAKPISRRRSASSSTSACRSSRPTAWVLRRWSISRPCAVQHVLWVGAWHVGGCCAMAVVETLCERSRRRFCNRRLSHYACARGTLAPSADGFRKSEPIGTTVTGVQRAAQYEMHGLPAFPRRCSLWQSRPSIGSTGSSPRRLGRNCLPYRWTVAQKRYHRMYYRMRT